jgi:hypothetical protein
LDSWEYEYINVAVDGVVVAGRRLDSSTLTNQICGATSFDSIIEIDLSLEHSSSTLVLSISSTLDEPADNGIFFAAVQRILGVQEFLDDVLL